MARKKLKDMTAEEIKAMEDRKAKKLASRSEIDIVLDEVITNLKKIKTMIKKIKVAKEEKLMTKEETIKMACKLLKSC